MCLIAMSYVLFFSSYAGAKNIRPNVYEEKYAAYVIDIGSDRILHHENENKSLHPASLAKLMTLLMVFDALDRGRLRLHNHIYISQHAASMPPSKLDLPAGSTIKVEDAILALVTKSANDVAAALAEKIGGSEKRFAMKMTRKARTLGMKDTRFENASGLHHPRQVSTAHDMAILGRVLLEDYKKYYHFFSTERFTYQGRTYRNHNKLMTRYEGMDGMKTGYIRASGFNLMASAKRGDHRLVGVVFGGRNGRLRNEVMEQILDEAFVKIKGIYILASEVPVPSRKPLEGETETYTLASLGDQAGLYSLTDNNLPAPGKKPVIHTGVSHYDKATGSSRSYAMRDGHFSRWDMLDSSDENSMFNRMIGEGDYDFAVRKRIETGLIAIAAQLQNNHVAQGSGGTYKHMIIKTSGSGEGLTNEKPGSLSEIEPSAASLSNINHDNASGEWSIQVGAFASRDRAENAVTKTLNLLPAPLNTARNKIAPLKTAQGWIYRSRLEGYSKSAAKDACALLADCIALSPLKD